MGGGGGGGGVNINYLQNSLIGMCFSLIGFLKKPYIFVRIVKGRMGAGIFLFLWRNGIYTSKLGTSVGQMFGILEIL
jgi:hypothetical protein